MPATTGDAQNQPAAQDIEDLSDLPPGIYVCALKTTEGVVTRKFVKI